MKIKKTIDEMRQSHMPWPLVGAIAVFLAFMILFQYYK